jgi:hypothetical protein
MNDQLKLVFHNESTGDPYCILGLRNVAMDVCFLQRMLASLIASVENESSAAQLSMSVLAADVVRTMTSQVGAELMPPNCSWPAILTISIRLIGREFRLACKSLDFVATGESLPEKFVGFGGCSLLTEFEGNARQLREVVEQVKRSALKKSRLD